MPNTASIRARQIKAPCDITKVNFFSLPSTIGVPSGGRYNKYAPPGLAGVGGGIQRQIAIRVGKCHTDWCYHTIYTTTTNTWHA